MYKEDRIRIYNETVKIVDEGEYDLPNGDTISIVDGDRMVDGTVFYTKTANVDHDKLPRYDTELTVENKDCLYAARELVMDGYQPIVLNMASERTPGGGVINGSGAQEENIFRRTNIHQSLYQFHDVGKNYGIYQKKERYPLDERYGGIYTPFVTVFRGGEDVGYQLLDDPYEISVVSVAAVRKPRTTKDGKLVDYAVRLTKFKIAQMLDIALEHGHDAIVLSAFGCGAFKTPPQEMARLFNEAFESKRYKGAFKKVIFAIIENGCSFREHNPQGNLIPFKEVLIGKE